MLGYYIGPAHISARVYGVKPSTLMDAKDIAAPRKIFEEKLAPLFDKKLITWPTSSPISLYGPGIPPAQDKELAEGRPRPSTGLSCSVRWTG